MSKLKIIQALINANDIMGREQYPRSGNKTYAICLVVEELVKQGVLENQDEVFDMLNEESYEGVSHDLIQR